MKYLIILIAVMGLASCGKRTKDQSKKFDPGVAKGSKKHMPDEAHHAPQKAHPHHKAMTKAHGHHKDKAHWSYSGVTGPQYWGTLSDKYKMCSTGTRQSPIDLRYQRPAGEGNLKFDYRASAWEVVNNGHAIQVNFEKGNHFYHNGHKYELLQMHFHAPSEHTLSGRSFPVEAHFVHKDSSGQLAVVGVFFESVQENPFLKSIWSRIPSKKNKPVQAKGEKLNPTALLPAVRTHYNYAGSLTTPPCSEGVNWVVLNTPMKMSSGQLAQYRSFYSKTNRPVQPVNTRQPANYR
jgi:carbonic anhydrase